MLSEFLPLIVAFITLFILLITDAKKENFTNLEYPKYPTYAGLPLVYFNDPTSTSFNYLEYKNGAVSVPNALVYTNKNLYVVK